MRWSPTNNGVQSLAANLRRAISPALWRVTVVLDDWTFSFMNGGFVKLSAYLSKLNLKDVIL